ncbi:MAG: tetratricopeptide repeat protein [Cytophagaceae bacterium]
MKRSLLLLILLSGAAGLKGQSFNHEPMFGGAKKPASQEKEDKRFIERMQTIDGGQKKAAEYFIEKGWFYFHREILDTAMFRFNQAWLLDENNPDVYWGFGSIMGRREHPDKALEMFRMGLKKNPGHVPLKINLATAYMDKALGKHISENNKKRLLYISNRLLTEVEAAEPENSEALYKLAINAYLREEYKLSWAYLEKCKETGWAMILPDFVMELSSKERDPKGIFVQEKPWDSNY